MAKASWVVVNPQKGSGSGSVSVSSASQHTGRNPRTTQLTWKAANVADVIRGVSQAGKPEYVDIDNTASSEKGGQLVTIKGESNSAKLTFSLGAGDLQISLPSTYLANSIQVTNGAAINGDPGASAKYVFSIAIDVPANTSMDAVSRQIIVTDEAGNQDTCTLTIASGDAYVTIAEGVIELDYLGTPVSVAVESNTSWSIV